MNYFPFTAGVAVQVSLPIPRTRPLTAVAPTRASIHPFRPAAPNPPSSETTGAPARCPYKISLPPSLLSSPSSSSAVRLVPVASKPIHSTKQTLGSKISNNLGGKPSPRRKKKMRMSCNGCRVLRKGCSDACTIRPCLQWIKTPEAQANATVFLAKFYGRAGLLNLLAAPGPGADHLRPAVFRSLLYEACGRIVNPVYGSVGLLWSGQWQACQAAVEAVLKGEPVVRVASDHHESEAAATPPLGTRAACDIRHVAKDRDVLRVSRAGRTKFKRASSSSTTSKTKTKTNNNSSNGASPRPSTPTQEQVVDARAPSHHDHEEEAAEESAGSHQHLDDHDMAAAQEGSSEAEAGSHVSQAEEHHSHDDDEEEVGLELTLGLEPVAFRQARSPSCDLKGLSAASSLMGLRLQLPA